jgi:hypothetical protein
MARRGVVAAMLTLGIAAGCDPAFRFVGTVRDDSGAPVAGANVRIECSTVFGEATSDASGHFVGDRVGWCPLACSIEARSEGHAAWTGAVRDYCKKTRGPRGDACLDVEVDVVLAPSAHAPRPSPDAGP